jgi:nucleoside phosphorylase
MQDIDSILQAISQRVATGKAPPRSAQAEPSRGNELVRGFSSQMNRPEVRGVVGDTEERALSRETSLSTAQDKTEADVAVVAALPEPELSSLIRAFGGTIASAGREGVVYSILEPEIGGNVVKVVAAAQNDMGMVPAAILATKTLRAWKPTMLAMVGVCAGVKSRVNLGDVVVAKQLFDYGSGKLVAGKLQPDYQPVSLNDVICGYANNLATKHSVLTRIRGEWPIPSGKPDTDLKVHVGAMASGAAVVADETVVDGIKEHKRALFAIDMESYGAARAAESARITRTPWVIVKGVQDFADSEKSDVYREYASYASSAVLRELLAGCFVTVASRLDEA